METERAKRISNQLNLRFPRLDFFVAEWEPGQLSISYGAFTSPADVKRIEKFVTKIVGWEQQSDDTVNYQLDRIPF